MSVKDKQTVDLYVMHHASMMAMLANLAEFVDSMPPNDADEILNVDYGYTGSVGKMFEMLTIASQIADDMNDGPTIEYGGQKVSPETKQFFEARFEERLKSK